MSRTAITSKIQNVLFQRKVSRDVTNFAQISVCHVGAPLDFLKARFR